jgi:hypothetical protein
VRFFFHLSISFTFWRVVRWLGLRFGDVCCANISEGLTSAGGDRQQAAPTQINIVQNWFTELQQRMPVK